MEPMFCQATVLLASLKLSCENFSLLVALVYCSIA